MNSKISVVTVCYNAEKDIENTILSVINQSYENVEYIIVDGASKDGTLDVVNKYRDKISVIVSEPDKGIYDAMNKGIKLATGDWINFMNAGDCFVGLDVLNNIFNGNQFDGIDVVFGNSIVKETNTISLAGSDIEKLKYGPIYRHGSSFVRASIHKKYLFDLSQKDVFEYGLDYNCIYNLYYHNHKFLKVDENVMIYEQEGVSNHPIKNVILNYRITSQYKFSIVGFFYFLLRLLKQVVLSIFKR